MPIKLGLVITRRQNITQLLTRQQAVQQAVQQAGQQAEKNKKVKDTLTPQQKGLSLRRVMNAPTTGCKSCGG